MLSQKNARMSCVTAERHDCAEQI